MASMQCHKPATDEACPKTCQNKPASESSLGQKVSGFLKGHHGSHSSSHTQCSATATNGQGTMQLTARRAMEEPRRRVSTETRRQKEAEIFFRRSRMVFPAIAAAAATARATRKAAAERRTKLSSCGRSSIPIDHYDQQNERGL